MFFVHVSIISDTVQYVVQYFRSPYTQTSSSKICSHNALKNRDPFFNKSNLTSIGALVNLMLD